MPTPQEFHILVITCPTVDGLNEFLDLTAKNKDLFNAVTPTAPIHLSSLSKENIKHMAEVFAKEAIEEEAQSKVENILVLKGRRQKR